MDRQNNKILTFDEFLLQRLEGSMMSEPVLKKKKADKPDIENMMLENWNKQYQKIFDDFLNKNQDALRQASLKASQNPVIKSVSASKEISVLSQSFLVFALLLNLAFYYVYFAPDQTRKIISLADNFIFYPEKQALNLALNYLKSDNGPYSKIDSNVIRKIANDVMNKSEFVKNNNAFLSESLKKEFLIKAESLFGQVAGAEEFIPAEQMQNISQNRGLSSKIIDFASEYINRLKIKQKGLSSAIIESLK